MEYTIAKGDTLSNIAQANNTDVNSLAKLNNINNPNLVYTGQSIKLPTVNTTPSLAFNEITQQNSGLPAIKTPVVAPVTMAAPMSYAQSYARSAQPIDPREADQQNTLNSLKEQLGLSMSKETDIASLRDTTGLKDNQKQVLDLSNQIFALNNANEVQKLNIGQTTGGLTASQTQGEAQKIDRDNAIKALTLSSQLHAAQGNTQLAQNAIDQAITAKYAPIEARISALKTYLSANQSELERHDTKAYREQTQLVAAQEKDIANKIKNETDVSNMVVNANSQGAPPNLIAQASKAKSPMEAATILGVYSGDYLSSVLKKSQIAENYAQINKINAEYRKVTQEIKSTGTPLSNNAPLGSTASSLATWTNSAVNKASLVAEERSAISKSFAVVDQIGALQQNLKKDQTGFFGGKVKLLMASIGQNADAGTINAQITALVPQVARGIYGEVGVLTEPDTARYIQTLPNLISPEKQNDAVTALALTALRNGVKSRLDVASASKLDVSGFVPIYQQLTNKINSLNDNTGINDNRVISYGKANPKAQSMIKEMVATGAKSSEILSALGVE